MKRRSIGPPQTALIFLGTMVALAVIGGAAGLGVQWGVSALRRPPGVTAVQARVQTPPEPRLQVDPLADRQVMLEPDRLSSTYGWTDKAQGRARIPVEAAMRLLAQQGWPEPEAGR